MSVDDTKIWFELLGITTAPILYDGIYDEKIIKGLWDESKWDTMEGYVIRVADEFSYGEFRKCVGKFVRPSHVQPNSHHWFAQQVVPNLLKK